MLMPLSNTCGAIPAESADKVVGESSSVATPQLLCFRCPRPCLLLIGDKDERRLVCSGGDKTASGASSGAI